MRATVAAGLCLVALFMACTPLPVPHPERWTPEYGATDYDITETVHYSHVDAGLNERQ